jgi:FkbM family methyltransferase
MTLIRLTTSTLQAFYAFVERASSRAASRRLWTRILGRLLRAGLFRPLFSGDAPIRVMSAGHPLLVPRRFLHWHLGRGYEPITTELFRRSMRPGAVVLDVGAHIGYYTVIAARAVGPEGKVFAFEPSPVAHRLLQRNIARNRCRNVLSFRQAVSGTAGRRRFVLTESLDSNGFYEHPLSPALGTTTVDCTTVDEFMQDRDLDVAKIDVEGAEMEVLAGMQRTIHRNPQLTLFVELNPSCLARAGYRTDDLIRHLWELGFDITLVDDRAGVAYPIKEMPSLPEHDPTWYANLHCTRAGTR